MNKFTIRNQLWSTYCGFGAMFCLIVGWVLLAHFVPPPSPHWSALHIDHFFAQHRTGIRIGMIICFFGCALFLPWWATVAVQVKRIEGRFSPFAYVQIAGAACFVIEFLFPLTFWANAAFRNSTSPELVQKLNDLAWIPFLGLVSTAVVQTFAFSIAVLQDQREKPLFPRWFAYYSFWSALLYCPAGLIIVFKTGPFAWTGIISFWLVFIVFSAWVIVTTFMLMFAVKRQATDPPDPPEDAALAARIDELAAEVGRLKAREGATA
jgi:hypothetical protein